MNLGKFADIGIEALGGTLAVATLFGMSEQAVSNWKKPNRGFPPESFYVLGPMLIEKGFDASPVMFKQYLPVNQVSGLRRPPAKPRANGNIHKRKKRRVHK